MPVHTTKPTSFISRVPSTVFLLLPVPIWDTGTLPRGSTGLLHAVSAPPPQPPPTAQTSAANLPSVHRVWRVASGRGCSTRSRGETGVDEERLHLHAASAASQTARVHVNGEQEEDGRRTASLLRASQGSKARGCQIFFSSSPGACLLSNQYLTRCTRTTAAGSFH